MIHVVERTASTNDDAMELARAGAPAGTAVRALGQTAGRGRLGRPWQTMEGGLAISVVLRPTLPPARWPVLVLAGIAALADDLGLWIKWPNDLVLADGRKVGGVLAEADVGSGALVVGLGMNTSSSPPQAGALVEVGPVPADLAERVVADLLGASDQLDGWRRRAWGLGRRVVAGTVAGVAEGVDDDGALRVRVDHGRIVAVRAGDVQLID